MGKNRRLTYSIKLEAEKKRHVKEQGDYSRIMRNVIEKDVGQVSNKLWDFMSHANRWALNRHYCQGLKWSSSFPGCKEISAHKIHLLTGIAHTPIKEDNYYVEENS